MSSSLTIITTLTSELVRHASQFGLSDRSRSAIEQACVHVHKAGFCIPADWLDVLGLKHHDSVAHYELIALSAWVQVAATTQPAEPAGFDNGWRWAEPPTIDTQTGEQRGMVSLVLAAPLALTSLAELELEADRLFAQPVVADGFTLLTANPMRPDFRITRSSPRSEA